MYPSVRRAAEKPLSSCRKTDPASERLTRRPALRRCRPPRGGHLYQKSVMQYSGKDIRHENPNITPYQAVRQRTEPYRHPSGNAYAVLRFSSLSCGISADQFHGNGNTLILSQYSDDAVAAVGAANQLLSMIFTFYTVISTGTSIFISHRLGAKKPDQASDAAFTSILCSFALSLCVGGVLSLFAERLMGMMNLTGQVLTDAAGYFRICVSFSFFQALMSSVSAIFRSYGLPKIAVIASLFMNAMNAILNCIVIFRPFETPMYGVTGIAVTNVISRGLAFLLIAVCLWRSNLDLQFTKKNLKTLRCIGSILHIGLPGGISSLSYSTSQVVSTSILGILGTTAISTKIYLSTIFFYIYVVGMALGTATSLIIGWLTGAGEYDKAYRLNLQNLRIAVLLNIAGSSLICLFGRPLLRLFTDDPAIFAMAAPILFIDIFVEIGRAFNHIEDNSCGEPET